MTLRRRRLRIRGCVRLHKRANTGVSPLRCAPVEMTDVRARGGERSLRDTPPFAKSAKGRAPGVGVSVEECGSWTPPISKCKRSGAPGTRIVRLHKRANTGVSPLRCAPVEMTDVRARGGERSLRDTPPFAKSAKGRAPGVGVSWKSVARGHPDLQVREIGGTRIVRLHKRANTGVSPLRCAPVEMTDVRARGGERSLCDCQSLRLALVWAYPCVSFIEFCPRPLFCLFLCLPLRRRHNTLLPR